jgi:hypothetical protein
MIRGDHTSSVEEVDGVGQQIIVEVFIEMQHEVETDLTGVHHLLGRHTNSRHITILVEALNDRSGVEAWDEEVDVASGLPGLLGDDLLCLVADVVDGSGQSLACLVPESMVDGDGTHVEVLDELVVPCEAILGILEPVLGLTQGALIDIDDVVVVDNTIGIFAIGLFVTVSHQAELPRLGLPNVGKGKGEVVDIVDLSSGVVDLDSGNLSVLGIGPEIEVVELHLSLVLVSKPDDHGVVVASLDWVLVGPLIFDGLKLGNWLACLGIIGLLILVVGESEPGIVEGPLLDYDEHLGIVEGLNVHLSHIIEEVIVVDVPDSLGLEVDDIDMGFRDIHDDDFAIVEHTEEVDDVRVFVLEEDLSIGVDVDDGLVGSRVDDSGEDEGVVEGGGEAEDLGDLVLQVELVVVLEQHI